MHGIALLTKKILKAQAITVQEILKTLVRNATSAMFKKKINKQRNFHKCGGCGNCALRFYLSIAYFCTLHTSSIKNATGGTTCFRF